MALRNIRINDDPILRKVCKPVQEITKKTEELVGDMLDTMYEANGVGLAAPQVTYLMHELKEEGFPVSTDATTVDEARDEILRVITKRQDGTVC